VGTAASKAKKIHLTHFNRQMLANFCHSQFCGNDILKKKRWEGAEWMDLAQDTAHWLAVANTITNLPVTQHAGNFLAN
jgi:hypothetical protein